ncbi:response regulator [Neptuniibacter marinus]|uniref:response regulator n=1 Tax=Neptuniibacter marinus TaxID=1806670 RepID=UPI003B5AE213
MRKIIILDDEKMMLKSLERRIKLENLDYEPHCFSSIKAALAELEKGDCYAFITDVKMPLLTGDQVVNYISQKFPEQPCIVITGQAERREIKNILDAGNVKEILWKPIDFEKLVTALDNIAVSE